MIRTNSTLNKKTISRINKEHLLSTPIQKSELLFMFGGRDGIDARVEMAHKLYTDGYYEKVIISGGITKGGGISECSVLTKMMKKKGIPSENILEEHRATNTGENVRFSLPILQEEIGLNNINRVICLGEACTARRYPMTLHRYWPEVTKMLVTISVFKTPTHLWHTNSQFAERMLIEWNKIPLYKAKGYIVDWPDT